MAKIRIDGETGDKTAETSPSEDADAQGSVGVSEDETTEQQRELSERLVEECPQGFAPEGSAGGRSSCVESPAVCEAGSVYDGRDDAGRALCRETPGPALADADDDGVVGFALLGDFRAVDGWAGWLCSDLGNGKSKWFLESRGAASASVYAGDCASWSRDPAKAAYGAVEGWVDWACADLPGGASSMWYKLAAGLGSATRYSGNCASWKRSTDPELAPYHAVSGWAGWLCADFKDGRKESMWYLEVQGSGAAKRFTGNCASWSKAVAKSANALGAYQEVSGWAGWLCADYTDGRSRSKWYQVKNGVASAADYDGNCASWAKRAAMPAAAADQLEAYGEVKGWPNWLCADFADGRKESMWYQKGKDATKALKYAGDCAAWAAKPQDPNALDSYRDVTGWPDWQCADFLDAGRNESMWFLKAKGVATAIKYPKRCNEWIVQARSVLTSYRVIAGWPNWLCADFTDGRKESLWYQKGKDAAAALKYAGTCDSWAK